MSLQQISSIAELRAERQRLLAEKSYAYQAIGDNFSKEKDALVNKFSSGTDTVQHGIMNGGKEAVSFFEKIKIPALGAIAALIGVLLTTWLTGDEEEEQTTTSSRQENDAEANEAQQTPADSDEENAFLHDNTEQAASLEERVYAAMKAFKQKEKEEVTGTEKSAFLTVLGVLAPVVIKELVSGNLLQSFTDIMGAGGSAEEEMQDISNNIADQMEAMQEDLLKQEA